MEINDQIESIKQKVSEAYTETCKLLQQEQFVSEWTAEYVLVMHTIAVELLQLKLKL